MSGSGCAVFYVTDLNFALPTLISAMGVRRWVPAEKADIRIVTIDVPEAMLEGLRRFCEPHGLKIDVMDAGRFSNFDVARFNKTHVPISTLGRFFMLDCVAETYEHIVYIDGDTWILKDPTALIDYRPPAGMLAAAEGPSYFYRRDLTRHGRETRAYFKGIGVDGDRGYFNAGVLSASAETWRELSREAFDYFLNNIERCIYHDESALNAVAKDRRVRLSPRWNFNSAYRYWGLESWVDPVIYHFTGAPKPWVGVFTPWNNVHGPYIEAARALDELGLPLKALSEGDRAQGVANDRQYRRLRGLFLPRLLSRRSEVGRLLKLSVLGHAGEIHG